MKLIWTLLIVACGLSAEAQEIAGKVMDDKREPVLGVVYVMQGSAMRGATTIDYDGNYRILPLDPGRYDLTAISGGYDTVKITDVVVEAGKATHLNINVGAAKPVQNVIIRQYRKPVVDEQAAKHTSQQCESEQIPANELVSLQCLRVCAYPLKRSEVSTVLQKEPTIATIEIANTFSSVYIEPFYARRLPYTDIRDIAAIQSDVYQARRGDDIHVYGSR